MTQTYASQNPKGTSWTAALGLLSLNTRENNAVGTKKKPPD